MKVNERSYIRCDICGIKIDKRSYPIPNYIFKYHYGWQRKDVIKMDVCEYCFREFKKFVIDRLEKSERGKESEVLQKMIEASRNDFTKEVKNEDSN